MAKATHDVMRTDGPFDKLNAAKEVISRYRFQIEEAQNGNQDDTDYLVEEFDSIFQDLRERKLFASVLRNEKCCIVIRFILYTYYV